MRSRPLVEFWQDYVEACEDAERSAERMRRELAQSRQKFRAPRVRR